MARRAATCSECPKRLVDDEGRPKPAGTKTCGQSCRQKRARRIRRAQRAGGKQSRYSPAVQEVAAATREGAKDVAHEVMKEELRPIVRESLTSDVLDAIGTLVALTPLAIARLQEDLDSYDETVRQRAYTLLLRYTMGNPSVAPPPAQQAPAPMSVVFNIPRPGDSPADTTTPGVAVQIDSDAEELRQCTDCSEHKTPQEFVGASSRCQECFDRLHATLAARFAVKDETAPDA